MISNSETGHAKNVANFQLLVSFCQGYGELYNPSRNEISIAGLQNTVTQAQQSLTDLKNAKTTFDNATNQRRNSFTGLPKFSSQVVNALAAAGISPLVLDDAKGVLRKLRGRRAKQANAAETPAEGATTSPEEKQISVSQVSYDNLTENFSKLVIVAAQQKEYAPNEKEFTVEGLQAKLDELINANAAVVKAYTYLSNARLNRNNILYNPQTGLKPVSAAAKLYIKSIFGAASPQYKQVSGIKFTSAK